MRKSAFLFVLLSSIVILDIILATHLNSKAKIYEQNQRIMRVVVYELGCSDLAVATEARYTRHPSVSDTVVPFMDHPGDIDHFPTGSFWVPVR